MPSSSNAMQECIDHCLRCYQTCLSTVRGCLEMGGKHAEPNHVALMMTCAGMCETSASAMLLETAQHHETCRACAALCRACAADCRRVGGGDASMEACAAECERCAESCERMSGHAA